MPEVTLVEAINMALARAMQDDSNVVVLGEDAESVFGMRVESDDRQGRLPGRDDIVVVILAVLGHVDVEVRLPR